MKPVKFQTYPSHSRRGVTLPELLISITISGLITAFLGFLTFMAMRNTVIVHEQILSQTAASAAADRIATDLRGAINFARFPGDPGPELTRVLYVIPSGSSVTTNSVVYDAGTKQLKLYKNATGTGIPDATYRTISECSIQWETEFRLTLKTKFNYAGFAFYFNRPQMPLYGQFITDVIAKNHYLDQGTENYGLADSPTSSPASL